MTYAKNLFEGVPKKNVNKSRFNLSQEFKAGINCGKIIPIICEPTMPGDEFDIPSIEFMFRFTPLYYPIMQMASMYCNLFWIPNRILWRATSFDPDTADGWINFITLTREMEHPTVTINNELDLVNTVNNDTVPGFLGVPYYRGAVDWTDTLTINCLPLSAYLAVWDEYYRNPQLEQGRWFNLQPGDNTTAFDAAFVIEDGGMATGRYRCFSSKWEKDYFTSALPTPQAGDPVQIPMVNPDFESPSGLPYGGPFRMRNQGTNTPATQPADIIMKTSPATGDEGAISNNAGQLIYLDVQESAANIRELRFAEALQTFKERILKVGQRYTDYIKGLFGNNPTPGSVDVPVWFGYYRGKIQISDVVQTSTTEQNSTVYKTGQYVGRADLYEKTNSFNLYCSEHGWLLGLMEIKPNTGYGQGIPRWFRYQLPTDYPLDIFSGIGDQEILKEEILYMNLTAEIDKNQETFGYIPRYSEMRFRNNRWVGNMGTQFGISQHLGRHWVYEQNTGTNYDNLEINADFINMFNPDPLSGHGFRGGLRESDVFTVLPSIQGLTSENTLWAHIFISMFVNRNLPMFSTPKLGV